MSITDSWFHLVVNEKERNEAVSFSSPHPANNHVFKAPLSAGENSSEAGLFHTRCPSVRLQIKHLGSVMSSAWLLFAAMEAFNKKGEKKKHSNFISTLRCPWLLCVWQETGWQLALSPSLSLFNYLHIASYVQFNFLRILPSIPSNGFKGKRFRGAL